MRIASRNALVAPEAGGTDFDPDRAGWKRWLVGEVGEVDVVERPNEGSGFGDGRVRVEYAGA